MADVKTTRSGVAGLFQDEIRAGKAIDDLKQAGFSGRDIGVATRADGSGKTERFWDKVSHTFGKQEHPEQATELRESLVDAGLAPSQADYLDRRLGGGGILLTVHTDGSRKAEAASILEHDGADLGTGPLPRPVAAPPAGEQRIQLLGEILRVHKERAGRGEVRLHKDVVSEKQNLEVPVTREEVVVERVPGHNREATNADIGSDAKDIRIPVTEERVQVEKKPVVTEEVRVGKRQVQSTEHVSGEVRHEELRTEGEVEEAERLKEKDKRKRTA